jgi:hypothetical protein
MLHELPLLRGVGKNGFHRNVLEDSSERRVVQGLPLPSSHLADGATGGGEGGVSCWGAVKMTRLSCHRFRSNQVRLALSSAGLQPGQFVATNQELVADKFAATAGEDRGRLVKHARYYWLLLAEGHLTRRRFGAMLGRIVLLPMPTG